MAFCHDCGEELESGAKFCQNCGAGVKDHSSHSNRKRATKRKRRSGLGAIILLIIILGIAYFAVNLWALSELQLDTSGGSIVNSLLNVRGDISLSSSTVGTDITVHNPTFLPVISSKISLELKYGDNLFGKGQSGFVGVMPNSNTETPVDFEVYHGDAIKAGVEGLVDLFKGTTKTPTFYYYAHFGPIKIRIGELR
ncbi:MAG: zinc ribbon domain-containing protein [Candidatus Heimdallarchaeaceae archaeon]